MTDFFSNIYFVQWLWIIAFIASMITFLMKRDQRFIQMMVLVSFLWSIHFFALWLLSAALINFVDIFKNLLALKFKKNNSITLGVIIFYIGIGIYTFSPENIVSIFPVIASLASIYVVFHLQGFQMRLWFIGILIFWLIYNYLWGSIWGVMSDITLIIVWVIGIYRLSKSKA